MRVHLLDDPNRILADPNPTQAHSRKIVTLKGDEADDDDDDDDDLRKTKAPKVKAKVDVTDAAATTIIPVGIVQATRLPARPIPVAAAASDAKVIAAAVAEQNYEVTKADHGLRPGQRVQARLPLPDNGKPQKVIPYSAVIYDRNGATWTYTNPEPLVFVRNRIDVDFVEGRRAVLKEGPAAGIAIVTAGAAVLLGIEQKFGQ